MLWAEATSGIQPRPDAGTAVTRACGAGTKGLTAACHESGPLTNPGRLAPGENGGYTERPVNPRLL